MLDIDAPIVPNMSAAGVRIGQPVSDILANLSPNSVEELVGRQVLTFSQVTIWVKDGLVHQIGVGSGYRGTLAGGIGIGSTLLEVGDAFGVIAEDGEDNLSISDSAGWCFETEEWRHGHVVSDNLDSRITKIFVFSG